MTRLKVALLLSGTVLLAGCGMAGDARTLVRSAAAIVFDPLIAVQSSAILAQRPSRFAPAVKDVRREASSIEKDAPLPDSLPEQRFRKASLAPASTRRQVVRVICASRITVVTRSTST